MSDQNRTNGHTNILLVEVELKTNLKLNQIKVTRFINIINGKTFLDSHICGHGFFFGNISRTIRDTAVLILGIFIANFEVNHISEHCFP